MVIHVRTIIALFQIQMFGLNGKRQWSRLENRDDNSASILRQRYVCARTAVPLTENCATGSGRVRITGTAA